jgi:hypothetical protein
MNNDSLSQEFENSLEKFDFAGLKKKTRVPVQDLVKLSSYPRGELLRVWCLALITKIFKYREMTARLDRFGNIQVLSDVDASQYNLDSIETGIRQVRARTRRLTKVDREALTEDEQLQHDLNILKANAYFAGLRKGQTQAAADIKLFMELKGKSGLGPAVPPSPAPAPPTPFMPAMAVAVPVSVNGVL